MKNVWPIILIACFFAGPLAAQQSHIVRARVIHGDTIPEITLSSFTVASKRTWKSYTAWKKYEKLKKKVVKVYPYAYLAGKKLRQYSEELANVTTEKEKKKFYKRIERELKAEYEGELRKLTISEGRILIKLIDRETGNTSYELVEELRGKFSAFFWQGLARIFGHNLKSHYDPDGADREIEFIVRQIEAGYLQVAYLDS